MSNDNLIVDSPGFNSSKFRPGNVVILFNRADKPICTGIVLECQAWVLTLAIYDPNEDSGIFDRQVDDYNLRGIKPYFVKIEEITTGEIKRIALIKPQDY